jgi:hypothetical protein
MQSQTGDFHNTQEATEIPTDLLVMFKPKEMQSSKNRYDVKSTEQCHAVMHSCYHTVGKEASTG